MRFLISTAAALLMTGAALAADPVGTYEIKGTNPGNRGGYSGTVTVTKTGETFSVVWVVGGSRYVGTGIGNKDFLAVSYKSDNNTFGLALYGANDDDWAGVWTYSNARDVGTEVWERK